MRFDEALPIVMRGGRIQREAWRSDPKYGLQIARAGSGNYLVLGYGSHLGASMVWRTAPVDCLASDWRECDDGEPKAASVRAYKDD